MERRRGIALVSTLLMLTVLLMLLLGAITRTFGEDTFTHTSRAQQDATYAAETALALTMSHLEQTPAYASSFSGTLPNGSSYSVDFGTGASVNNLNGATAADGPRGIGSVAPRSAFLVIQGKQGKEVRRLQAVVVRGLPVPPMHTAIRASGNITLNGNVDINGLKSLTDTTPVMADLVSNSAGNETGTVRWIANSGHANIDGAIRTVSSLATSIQASGANVTKGMQPGSAPQTAAPIDIVGKVAAASSTAAPVTLTAGQTTLSGNRFNNGDLVYEGDLVLNDANLYVQGNLKVTGTVKGSGSVFVTGNTSFFGDADLRSGSEKQVSLMSHGSVTLRGYDGSAYIEALAPVAYGALKSNLSHVQDKLAAKDPSLYFSSGPEDNYQAVGIRGAVDAVRLKLALEPDSTRKEWLSQRLDVLHTSDNKGVFDWPGAGSGSPGHTWQDDILDTFLSTGKTQGGLWDAFNDRLPLRPAGERLTVLNRITNVVTSLDYNKPGTAYFNGQVYTNGFVYADSDLTIIGSLQALADGSQSPSQPDGSTTVRPGELYLKNTTVTFVDDEAVSTGSTLGTMALKLLISE